MATWKRIKFAGEATGSFSNLEVTGNADIDGQLTIGGNAFLSGNTSLGGSHTANQLVHIKGATPTILFEDSTNGDMGFIGDVQDFLTGGSPPVDSFGLRSEGELRFGSGGNNLALTIDTSQNATFSGDVDVSGSYLKVSNATNPYIYLNDTNAGAGIFQQEGNNTRIGADSNGSVFIVQNNATAVTIDTSKNATFAGNVEINGTGILTIDSSTSVNLYLDRSAANKHSSAVFQTAGSTNWALGLTDSDVTNLDGDEFYIGQTANGTDFALKIDTDNVLVARRGIQGDANESIGGTAQALYLPGGFHCPGQSWMSGVFNIQGEIRGQYAGTHYIKGNTGFGAWFSDSQKTVSGTVHIKTGSAGSITYSNLANMDDLVVENSDHGGITILSPANKTGHLVFGDPDDEISALLGYDHNTEDLYLSTEETNGALIIRTGNATTALTINASQNATFAGQIQAANGSAAAPAYAFSSQASTGMYKPGTSQLYFSVAGTRKMRVEASQIVLEDEASVTDKLTVSGTIVRTATNNSAGTLWTAIGDGNVPHISIQNSSTTNNTMAGLFFKDDQAHRAGIHAKFTNHTDSSEASQLIFSTATGGNTREKMVLDESGRLGIGTASPSADLHIVQSGTDTTDGIRLTRDGGESFNLMVGTIGQTSGGFSIFDVTDNAVRLAINTSGNVGIGTTNPLAPLDVAGNVYVRGGNTFYTDNIEHYTGGSTALTIGSANELAIKQGKVGIGTSSPSSLLEVSSTNPFITIQRNNNATNPAGGIKWTTSDDTLKLNIATNTLVGSDNGCEFNFGTSNKMFLTSGGNLGIGTTSPSVQTHILGTGNELLRIESNNDSVQGADLRLYHESASPTDNDECGRINFSGDSDTSENRDYVRLTAIATDVSETSKNGRLVFSVFDDNTFANPLTLDGGNVGIGTTSPDYPLEVNGTSSFQQTRIANNQYHHGFLSGGSLRRLIGFQNNDLCRINDEGEDTLIGADNKTVTIGGDFAVDEDSTFGGKVSVNTTNAGQSLTVAGGELNSTFHNTSGANTMISVATDRTLNRKAGIAFNHGQGFTGAVGESSWYMSGKIQGQITQIGNNGGGTVQKGKLIFSTNTGDNLATGLTIDDDQSVKIHSKALIGGSNKIGTANLIVQGTSTTSLGDPMMAVHGATAVGTYTTIGFGHIQLSPSYPESPAEIGLKVTNSGSGTYGDLIFATRSSGSGAPTTRLTIASDGNATFSGTINSGSITSTGTVQAEHLYSTDDAQINDNLTVNGSIHGKENIYIYGGNEGSKISVDSSGGNWYFDLDFEELGTADLKIRSWSTGSAVDMLTLDGVNHKASFSGDILMASGKGIDFSSGSEASGNTSTLLDDYEEGAWTPEFTNESLESNTASATLNDCHYVKIGAQVTLWAKLANINKGDASSNFAINNLPFTVEANHAAGNVMCNGFNFVGKLGNLCAYVKTDETIKFYETGDGIAWDAIDWSEIDNTSDDCNFYVTYRTTQ